MRKLKGAENAAISSWFCTKPQQKIKKIKGFTTLSKTHIYTLHTSNPNPEPLQLTDLHVKSKGKIDVSSITSLIVDEYSPPAVVKSSRRRDTTSFAVATPVF